MGYNAVANTVLGLQGPTEIRVRVINRTGTTRSIGDVCQFDETQSDDDVTNSIIGDENSSEANVIAPVTAQLGYARFCVVVGGDLTNDGIMEVVCRGRVDALFDAATTVGLYLVPLNAAHDLGLAGGAGLDHKIIAIAREATAGAGVAECDFDGINGFGTDST